MNRKVLVAIAAMLGVLAVSAKAGTQNDSGCGFGSMLIRDNVAWKQIFAATTNGIFGNQTFGITSGTLGCSSGGIGKTARAQENFVVSNFQDLSREMAAGKGEYISSLSTLMGCADAGNFAAFTQSKYEALFPAAGTQPEAMLRTLRSELSKDSKLAASCSLI